MTRYITIYHPSNFGARISRLRESTETFNFHLLISYIATMVKASETSTTNGIAFGTVALHTHFLCSTVVGWLRQKWCEFHQLMHLEIAQSKKWQLLCCMLQEETSFL